MSHVITPLPVSHPASEPYPQREQVDAAQECFLESELSFYQGYAWCLNPFPTVRETIEHLGVEINRLREKHEPWQADEVMTNVFLLSCALLNSVDECLRGKSLRLPKQLADLPLARGAGWATENLAAVLRQSSRRRARRWRERLQTHLDAFLSILIAGEARDAAALVEAGNRLAILLRSQLPSDLHAEHIYFPSAFRRLDLTHFDVLALGRRFVARFPDRQQKVVLMGLRTAGSYFAPLIRAVLRAEGYRTVASMTVHPVKGLGAQERAELVRCARQGYSVVVLDDPPYTGDTLVMAAGMARKAGFSANMIVALVPAHPAGRDLDKVLSPTGAVVLTLKPEQWHKQRLLDLTVVEDRLTEYFRSRGFVSSRMVASGTVEQLNAQLQRSSVDARSNRLKRIYEVRLTSTSGQEETRYVLAKSVGWGWLGYHAFLAGQRLSGFVPPMLGLRDGILYTEWIPQSAAATVGEEDRRQRISATASYVAARVRLLSLGSNPSPTLGLHRHHDGFRLLEKVLSKAYGGIVTDSLMRSRVRRQLCHEPCPVPTLIDGKMHPTEWIVGPCGPLKTDYEHHGMGKNELNVIDPAYDLAETALHLALSFDEEGRLIRRYVQESGDAGVERRLFLQKVLAGSWAMASAQKNLFGDPQLSARQQEFHQQFMNAWNFLTVQTARFCGSHCQSPKELRWRSPLVVLDIDGVLDRRMFGFPCTTAAGIEALSLLHSHEFAVAVNTARSVGEVKDYCQAYRLAGGVAEYGSYLWDAVAQRGRVLIHPESLRQLDKLKKALQQLPGVFLDDRHQYSIRAFTYEDKASSGMRERICRSLISGQSFSVGDKGPVPLPALAVRHLMTVLRLDRLHCHQTTMDTTVVAKEVDKGTGLAALDSWVLPPRAETIAVGDSAPDLPMFRAATRSYAPAQVSCASQARLLGCQISRHPYQRGLLSVVRSILHPDGRRCRRCAASRARWPTSPGLFLDLLQAADRKQGAGLIRALLDPVTYRTFVR